MSLDILATYSLKLRYSASYRISYVVISVVSVSSILTIQDVIKVVEVSTATEPWVFGISQPYLKQMLSLNSILLRE